MSTKHKILLVRHRTAAIASRYRLQQNGYECVVLPISHIDFFSTALPDGRFDATIFTSAQAVISVSKMSDTGAIRDLPVYCVGKHTAMRLNETGFKKIAGVYDRAADLMHDLKNSDNQNAFLYVCGKYRAFDFATQFEAIRKSCFNWETYTNQLLPLNPDQIAVSLVKSNSVFLYSRRIAEHFFNLVDRELSTKAQKRYKFIAISQNVANAIPRKFQKNSYVAKERNEQSMIECLRQIDTER